MRSHAKTAASLTHRADERSHIPVHSPARNVAGWHAPACSALGQRLPAPRPAPRPPDAFRIAATLVRDPGHDPALGTADALSEGGLCHWEVDMGRFCAWCGSVMLGFAATRTPSSHAICSGCVEELESSLAGVGLRLTKAASVASDP